MSSTNSGSTSGEPVTSLPTASTIADTDTLLGVVGGVVSQVPRSTVTDNAVPIAGGVTIQSQVSMAEPPTSALHLVRQQDLSSALANSSLGMVAASAQTAADTATAAQAASSVSAGQAASAAASAATILTAAQTASASAETSAASAANAASGVAQDASAAKVLVSTSLGADLPLTYRGYWDASANSPALVSGAGNTGDLYIVSKSGATTLDGVASWTALDGAYFLDGKWQCLSRAGYPAVADLMRGVSGVAADDLLINSRTGNALTIRDFAGYILTAILDSGDISTAGSKLSLSGTDFDAGAEDGSWLFRQRDGLSNVIWGVRADGSPAFPKGAAQADLGVVTVTTDDFPDGVRILDARGFILLDTSGTWAGERAGDFTDAEIAARDRLQLAKSASIMAGPGDLLRARPVWGISVAYALGQSEMMGYVSLPALSTTQPYDNITFGGDPRGFDFGIDTAEWTPRGGDATPAPLVAVNVSQTDFSTLNFPRALVYKPASVTVTVPTVTSGNPQITIATTDATIDFSTGFSVGQTIQCSGFTGSAAVNNESGSIWYSNYITLTSVSAQSITGTCDGVWYSWTPVAVTGAVGVSIAPLRITQDFGEQQSIAALNFYRGLQLGYRGLQSDASHLLALVSCCVSGTTIEELSKGASPDLFGRVGQSAAIAQAQATKAGASIGCFVLEFCQGGSNTSTDYDTYKPLLEQYFTDVKSELASVFGQTVDPFVEIVPISGMNLPATGTMDVCRAQVDYALATPGVYIPTVGYPAIDYGPHYSSNGERYVGAMRAKVRHRVITQGLAWKPLIMEAATLRGRTILVDCHVPYPPLQVLPTWEGQEQTTSSDLGFGVRDTVTGDVLPVSSVSIVGETQIQIVLGAIPANPVWVTYGDNNHDGSGNVYDSDPAVARDVYLWWEGSGAPYSENVSDYLNNPYPLQNPMINYAIQAVKG